MYDYYLGGKDNFQIDRDAADHVLRLYPESRQAAQNNRGFLIRAARFLAAQGIDQYIDLGTGIPTSPNIHEIVREVHPNARVAYVDYDPVVTAHNRALRARYPEVIAIEADVREPSGILTSPDLTELIDFNRPVAVLLIAILHFVDHGADAIVRTFRDHMAPGSYIAMSVASTDGVPEDELAELQQAYSGATSSAFGYSRNDVTALFDGFELVDPGIVDTSQWRADESPTRIKVLAGVGVKRT